MRAKFLLGRPNIKVGKHFNQRLKNRCHIKKEKSRTKFIKKIADKAISIYNISQEKFNEFYSYMYKRMKAIQKKNLYAFLVLFENWFIVTSIDGSLITIFSIENEYKNIYHEIIKYNEENNNEEREYDDTESQNERAV